MKDYIIATILCLATVGVLASCTAPELPVSSDDPSPAVSGDETDSSASLTAGNPTFDVVDGFVINNGVLVEYIGKDTELVLPEDVSTITSTSFSSCAEEITSLTLGDRIQKIAPLTFAGMTNLEEFHISPDNSLFTYENGVLLNHDRSLMIVIQGSNDDFLSNLHKVTAEIRRNRTDSTPKQFQFAHQNALITIDAVKTPYYRFLLNSIDFNGIHFEPTEELEVFLSDSITEIYQNEEMLIFAQPLPTHNNCTFLLADGMAIDISDPILGDHYYYYGLDRYGNMTYTCYSSKYIASKIYSDRPDDWLLWLHACAGYDEYHSETGFVRLVDGQVTYLPTAAYTVGEKLYPDGLFEEICKEIEERSSTGNKQSLTTYGYPYGCDTLEEIFAYNKEHYESITSPTGAVVEVAEGVFLDVDGTLILPEGTDDFDFSEIIQSVEAGDQICTEINQIIIGNTVLKTKMIPPDDPNSTDARLYIMSLTAMGHTVSFGHDQVSLPYHSIMFALDDCFVLVYSQDVNGPNDQICFVTEAGVTRFDAPVKTDGTDYNASCYDFYPENGQLCYTRTIFKYNQCQYVGQILEECVSRDELYRETGYVTFDGAQPVYHPTKIETVSDVYNLDEHYAQYLAFLQSVNSPISIPATLDEYLAQNALKYQRAY